ncbi:MAG TPA: hypothetical protein VFV52_17125 [Bacilli bacterium]|nr:hypothetical protein [Bacilli bacterium]
MMTEREYEKCLEYLDQLIEADSSTDVNAAFRQAMLIIEQAKERVEPIAVGQG